MAFTNNIRELEQIKKDNSTKYLKQELLMIEPISNIARVAVDDSTVIDVFAKLVSYYLSKSDFDMFNKVLMKNEIQFISNSIGYGDIISFSYDEKKQVNTVKYQNSDKLVNIVLKSNKNQAYVLKTINLGDRIHETKSTFVKNENGYYQDSFINSLITSEDEFTTIASDIYKYDALNNKLVKEFKVITKERDKILSRSSINTIVDNSDFIIDKGRFYTINKKQENKKMERCKELENRLVKEFN